MVLRSRDKVGRGTHNFFPRGPVFDIHDWRGTASSSGRDAKFTKARKGGNLRGSTPVSSKERLAVNCDISETELRNLSVSKFVRPIEYDDRPSIRL